MDTLEIANLISQIDAYPDEYLPIKSQAKKYLRNNSTIDVNKTLNIFHRPWVAPFNWGLKLYSATDKNWIDEFEQKAQKTIPGYYKNFLLTINGCFIYDLSLYGLPPSIYQKGTLDRSQLQCHDLIIANQDWINEYKVPKNYFHFGSRAYTYDENIGYFFDNNKIKSIRGNGKIVKEWADFSDFLSDEIKEAEKVMIKEMPKDFKPLTDE
jgi:hypothetical protein